MGFINRFSRESREKLELRGLPSSLCNDRWQIELFHQVARWPCAGPAESRRPRHDALRARADVRGFPSSRAPALYMCVSLHSKGSLDPHKPLVLWGRSFLYKRVLGQFEIAFFEPPSNQAFGSSDARWTRLSFQ